MSLCRLSNLLSNTKFNITGGATPKGAAYADEGIPFLRVQNVRENEIVTNDLKFIEKRIHENSLKRSQLKENDVLLTITGAYGLSALVLKHHLPANINQHLVRLRVNTDKIDPQFLTLYLNSKFAKIQFDRMVTGGTRPALDYPSIRDIWILFPTELTEQTRITKEITNIQKKGFEKIQKAKEILKSYDDVFLSNLNIKIPNEQKVKTFVVDPCDDRLESKWYYTYHSKILKILDNHNAIKIEQIKPKLTYGSSVNSDYYNTIPLLRINNITEFGFDLTNLKFISGELHKTEIKNLKLKKGDILVARSGSVGLCGYITDDLRNYVYGSYMIRLRMDENSKDYIQSEYLYRYLNSALGQLQFNRLKTGALQYNINTQQIKEIKVIVPEKQVQQKIIKDMNTLIASAYKLQNEGKTILNESKDKFIQHIISP